jgi:hypothetical protein
LYRDAEGAGEGDAPAGGAEIASGRKKGKAKAEGEDDEMWSVYDENGRTGPKKKGLGRARRVPLRPLDPVTPSEAALRKRS